MLVSKKQKARGYSLYTRGTCYLFIFFKANNLKIIVLFDVGLHFNLMSGTLKTPAQATDGLNRRVDGVQAAEVSHLIPPHNSCVASVK